MQIGDDGTDMIHVPTPYLDAHHVLILCKLHIKEKEWACQVSEITFLTAGGTTHQNRNEVFYTKIK